MIYLGNGVSSYLDFNYTPSVDGVNVTQNSVLFGYGAKVTSYPGTIAHGTRDATTSLAIYRLGDSTLDAICNDALDLKNSNVVLNSIALHAGLRTAASGTNSKASIVNSNYTYGNQISVGLPTSKMYDLCRNNLGTPASFDDQKHYYSFAGSGSINQANLLTAINNTLTALGVS
jgi:hypothetical protein